MNRKRDNSNTCSRGFTIVEMLMVIAIISVLIGIAFTAITSSVQAARLQKSDALCKIVSQGIATYYAQEGKWPLESLEDHRTDNDGERYTLTADEVRSIIQEVIKKQIEKKQPMMDISGLYVSKFAGEEGGTDYGMDFNSAVCGTERNPQGIRLAVMYFGYPESTKGYFRRFKITYSPSADAVSVMRQTDNDN